MIYDFNGNDQAILAEMKKDSDGIYKAKIGDNDITITGTDVCSYKNSIVKSTVNSVENCDFTALTRIYAKTL